MARATRMNEGFAQRLPIGTDAVAVRQRIEAMEHLLEGLVRIPGLRRKVGLDVLLDFVPGIGPTAAAAMGARVTSSAAK